MAIWKHQDQEIEKLNKIIKDIIENIEIDWPVELDYRENLQEKLREWLEKLSDKQIKHWKKIAMLKKHELEVIKICLWDIVDRENIKHFFEKVGDYYKKLEKYEDAIKCYEESEWICLINQGRGEYERSEWSEPDYDEHEEYVEYDEYDDEYHKPMDLGFHRFFAIANCYKKLKKYEETIEWYKKILCYIDLDPLWDWDNFLFKYLYGYTYNKAQKAISECEKLMHKKKTKK